MASVLFSVLLQWRGFSLAVDEGTLSFRARLPSGAEFRSLPPFEPQIRARAEGKVWPLSLERARRKEVHRAKVEGRPTVVAEFSAFPGLPEEFGVRVSFVALEEPGEFLIEIEAKEKGAILREIAFPPPLEVPKVEGAYAVLPIRQGCLIPAGWPEEVRRLYPLLGAWAGMAWWGGVLKDGGPGFMFTVETPYDAELVIEHRPKGAPKVGIRWRHSLGSFRYARRIRLCLFERADYNTLAKRYRRHAVEAGLLKPLEVKAKECPNVARLFDAAVMPVLICWHDMRRKPPSHRVTPFSEAARRVRELKRKYGLGNAFIHVDGWGRRGYDNLHPWVLPPCPEAGGWEGLRELSRAAEECGYLFGLHDNYRDFYLDSPAFDWNLAIMREDGTRPKYTAWAGGPQSVLCARFALKFLRRTIAELERHRIRLTAYYLDVFSSVPLDECYDPRHPMTREECAKLRGECLKFLHDKGIAVSSEDAAEWAIPYLDFVYWVPPPGFGVPVPLFELVYHDAVVVPCNMAGEPESALRCLLYGEIPLSSLPYSPKKAARDNFLRLVHKHIAASEMLYHRFLSPDRSVQETAFSSGVKIRVNFETGQCQVLGIEGLGSNWRPIPIGALDIRAEVVGVRYLGGNTFSVTLKWTVGDSLDRDYVVFTHFLHPKSPNAEKIAINADHRPPVPTSRWRPGMTVLDGPIRVTIPPKYAEGALEMVVGLYDPESGGRLPLLRCDPRRRLHVGKFLIEAEDGKVRGVRFKPPSRPHPRGS